jgi:Fic family protein
MSFDFDDFDVRSRFIDLDERTEELTRLLEQLPEERESFEERCRIAYIYHDSALDGIVLTYHELRAAVDKNVMSDSTLIPTYQEIKNHSLALDLVTKRALGELSQKARTRHAKVTLDDILELHILLNKDLPRKTPGKLRAEMPLHRTYFHNISDPAEIPAGLDRVCALVEDGEFRAQHPINQAALFHHEFMQVFPFTVDSGKVGRLLMNSFLMRAEYMPAVIHASDRQQYYEALKEGPEGVRTLIIDAMEAALEAGARHMKERLASGVGRRQVRAVGRR